MVKNIMFCHFVSWHPFVSGVYVAFNFACSTIRCFRAELALVSVIMLKLFVVTFSLYYYENLIVSFISNFLKTTTFLTTAFCV